MRAKNIEWDADEETCELCELPTEVEVPDMIGRDYLDEHNEADAIAEEAEAVGEWLSNTFGFCHLGFELSF